MDGYKVEDEGWWEFSLNQLGGKQKATSIENIIVSNYEPNVG